MEKKTGLLEGKLKYQNLQHVYYEEETTGRQLHFILHKIFGH